MTPLEIEETQKEIQNLKGNIADASQELQYSVFKDEIKEQIKKKELKIQELEEKLKNV